MHWVLLRSKYRMGLRSWTSTWMKECWMGLRQWPSLSTLSHQNLILLRSVILSQVPPLLGLCPCLNGTKMKMHLIIDHQNYFQTSKGHVTWIIWKVNSIPMHCDVAYECVHSLARGHEIRLWWKWSLGGGKGVLQTFPEKNWRWCSEYII